jgi:hypothetical protein
MPNQKVKIVYSLRIHVALQQKGFAHITEMKNPQNPHLNCWVYEATPRFIACFEALMGEVSA